MRIEDGGIIALGLTLGLRHALDSDHVVAVSTILTRARGVYRSIGIGAVWGLGHTVTVMAVGGVMILAEWQLPASWTKVTDLTVAAMLVLLGVLGLVGERGPTHDHPHAHHVAPSSFRALWVGMVHGLAGSAGIALLALGTVRHRALAVAYLLLFGLGTVLGMTALTGLMSLPLAWGARRPDRLGRDLRRGVALVSVAFGVFLGFEILVQPSHPEGAAFENLSRGAT
jgi:high-affinity nickel-transport protein